MYEENSTLLRELQKENTWWSGKGVPPELLKGFKRADFFAYTKTILEEEYPHIIIGPRRVGKSTLLYQLVDFLINKKNVSKNRIILLSLERPFFSTIKNPIKQSLELFEENILKEPLSNLKEPVYIFLDEASRNENWALQVKEYYDRKYKLNFLITGSSSPALFAKSTESLVGRHKKTIMLTLKFSDIVKMIGDDTLRDLLFQHPKDSVRASFIEAIKKENPNIFFDKMNDFYIATGSENETKLQLILNQYLLKGGYPEFFEKEKTWSETSRIMREAYFEAIISYDMVRIFKSRNPEKIKQLYTFLAVYTSQQVNLTNISNDLGITRVVLNEYLSQLKQTYLINIIRPYKKNKLKISNDLKKIYVGDIGLRNAILGLNETELSEPDLQGKLAETIAQDHSLRLKFCLEPNTENENFFWKSEREVDIIMELEKKLIPIESKYAENIKSEDISELRNVIKELNSPFGILLTKNSFKIDKENKMISMPLWLYLLMC
jgi:uncharacterized protein